MLDLEPIKALCYAATPGWRAGTATKRDLYEGGAVILCRYELIRDRVLFTANTHFPHTADVEFAVAAREDVPALVAEVERLRDALGYALRQWEMYADDTRDADTPPEDIAIASDAEAAKYRELLKLVENA